MTDPFDFIAVDRQLVCEFFAVFSRVEYALKEGGYVREDQDYAAPAWRRFAKECRFELTADNPTHVAVGYLVNYPPEVQTPRLKWEKKPFWGTTDHARAIESMLRVRNNLFHGGKSRPNTADGRDEQLIRHSLQLLYELINQNEQLRIDYETTSY